jgi:hypothetical protein
MNFYTESKNPLIIFLNVHNLNLIFFKFNFLILRQGTLRFSDFGYFLSFLGGSPFFSKQFLGDCPVLVLPFH